MQLIFKNEFLEVPNEVLNTVGAVSEETAKQMAKGVTKLAKSDIGVGITGIAGPTGGTPEKPVGLVYCGVCTKNKTYALKLDFRLASNRADARNYIRKLTSDAVLFTILNIIYEQM